MLAASARIGGPSCNPLRGQPQRRSAGAARRAAVRAQAQGEPRPWDTLSVDELQEWEVREPGRRRRNCHAPGTPAPPHTLARPCQRQIAVHPLASIRHAVQETGPPTPLLDTINYPVHLKNLGLGDLKKLCKELRAGGRWGRPCSSWRLASWLARCTEAHASLTYQQRGLPARAPAIAQT